MTRIIWLVGLGMAYVLGTCIAVWLDAYGLGAAAFLTGGFVWLFPRFDVA
jgi:hypothetical protein